MIGFNHVLAGGIIGKYLPLPLALPLAFTSHFALDALPHYGLPHHLRDVSVVWRMVFLIDFFASLCLIIIPIHFHSWKIFLCMLAAVVPDFIWVGRVIKTRSFDMRGNQHWFSKLHAQIQNFERPWGVWVELPLAGLLFYTMLH